MQKINTEIWACFLNEAMGISVNIMSPIWNGATNLAYKLAIDGAGILEICSIWSNDYLTGKKPYTDLNFCEKLNRLKTDSRYANNLQVQRLCEKYLSLVQS